MKTAILYARISDPRGATDRKHLAAQLAFLMECALQRGMSVVEEPTGEKADTGQEEKERE